MGAVPMRYFALALLVVMAGTVAVAQPETPFVALPLMKAPPTIDTVPSWE